MLWRIWLLRVGHVTGDMLVVQLRNERTADVCTAMVQRTAEMVVSVSAAPLQNVANTHQSLARSVH
jgi:hypothetical protein